jgi:hypothetical protein
MLYYEIQVLGVIDSLDSETEVTLAEPAFI